MKIRILNAEKMHCNNLENGQIVEVVEFGEGVYKQVNGSYLFFTEWKGRYFEIVEEDTPQKPLKESVKVHKKSDPQYTQAAMLQKHLKQLSELENAIERHDNKQNKRRQERQKLLGIINEGMPKRVKVVTDETLKPF